MVAEITDSTNVARAFSFIPITWFLGASIGLVSIFLRGVPSDGVKPPHWWDVRAACREVPCAIRQLLVSPEIPLLSSVLRIRRYRCSMLVHRRSVLQRG